MDAIRKYPRTRHILDSRLQPGDEDLTAAGFGDIAGCHLVVEEKIDGANAAIRHDDYITSSHRGHGHSIAKESYALRAMSQKQLQDFINDPGPDAIKLIKKSYPPFPTPPPPHPPNLLGHGHGWVAIRM